MRDTHSIVICVHNALDDVRACIESLQRSSEPFFEIITVDDTSDEPTRAYLETVAAEFGIKNIRLETRHGYTKAANVGIRAAKGAVVTLLNSDTIVPSSWSTKTLRALAQHPEFGIVGPLSNAASTQSVPSTLGESGQTAINALPIGASVEDMDLFCERVGADKPIPYVPLVHGFCMTLTRKCLDEVGEFDEEAFPLGYGEENDFCIRATNAGFTLGILITTYVYHAKSKSYSSEERVKLMQSGWDNLVSRYGKRLLGRSIKIMEEQPVLVEMRRRVHEGFKWNDSISTTLKSALVRPADTSCLTSNETKAIAFYLPQYHPIPFNDKAWGEGFTEWRNVVKAKPRFSTHRQPRLPGALGFYDLRRTSVLQEQAELAAQFGVHGVCMYYYRLNGRRLLQTPPEFLLLDRSINLRFCYCWANESWTRAWDGKSSEILLRQDYDDATFWGIVNDVISASDDDRYINVDGRPIFMIYQAAEIPDREIWIKRLRQELNRISGKDFLIGTVYSVGLRAEMMKELDFVVQFPPHRIPRRGRRITIPASIMAPYEPDREDYYEGYDDVIQASLESAEMLDKQFLGVCPDWDNTPRRANNAHTVIGSTPEKFSEWVRQAATLTQKKFAAQKISANVIFVNAWNEWAEGAVLEPSEQHGLQYLAALRNGLANSK